MTRLTTTLRRWRSDASGAAAIELALVLPFAIMLIVGCISGSQMIATVSSMHFAVQEASRCYAVNDTICGSATAAEAYAAGKYTPTGGTTPEFEAVVAGCGRRVTALATFTWRIGVSNLEVPLSATSCFPAVDEP
jgi:Flp pilus assembly protein TadG